jgi:hypothetical protein
LKVLSASLNCFEGTIPGDICYLAPYLSEIIFDGLTSGKHCAANQISFLGFNFLSSRIYGTLPECLFRMKHLTTLHASGNGIRGKLGEIPTDSSIRNLNLAWNNIESTIPKGYGYLNFDYLDVCVNRITGGAVPIGMNLQNPDASLKMHGNRLSGKIPTEYLQMQGIKLDMLEGNMFECSESRNELPANDPTRAQYSCGSQYVNWTLTVWIFAVGIATLLGLYHMIIYHQINVKLSSLREAASSFRLMCVKIKWNISMYFGLTQHPIFASSDFKVFFPRVAYFHRIYCHMRRLVLLVTAFVLCVLLPFYSIIFMDSKSRNMISGSVIYETQYVRNLRILLSLISSINNLFLGVDLGLVSI